MVGVEIERRWHGVKSIRCLGLAFLYAAMGKVPKVPRLLNGYWILRPLMDRRTPLLDS